MCEAHSNNKRLFPKSYTLFIFSILTASFMREISFINPYSWQIFAFVFAWLIELYKERHMITCIERSIAFLGMISYSFYLIHVPLIEFAVNHPIYRFIKIGYPYNQMSIGGVILILIPVALISLITYKLVEVPPQVFAKRLLKKQLGSSTNMAHSSPAQRQPK